MAPKDAYRYVDLWFENWKKEFSYLDTGFTIAFTEAMTEVLRLAAEQIEYERME